MAIRPRPARDTTGPPRPSSVVALTSVPYLDGRGPPGPGPRPPSLQKVFMTKRLRVPRKAARASGCKPASHRLATVIQARHSFGTGRPRSGAVALVAAF